MIDPDVILGQNVRIFNPDQVNLFGCTIGNNSSIGPFVEITRNVSIGKNCKIQSHSYICDCVTIEDNVFVGHGVMFTNDLYPQVDRPVKYLTTIIKNGVSIGTNSTIIGGITIGEYAIIGAGSVITKDIEPYSIYAGNPAKKIRQFFNFSEMLQYMKSKENPKTNHI